MWKGCCKKLRYWENKIKAEDTIALIPARSGSKSIKNKNIKLLGGKPLIAWSIESCKKSKLIKISLFPQTQNFMQESR